MQQIKRNFRQINYNPIHVDKNSSILLIANHYSWWDGFLLYWLNERLLHKNFYAMALDESVRKWSFLKYAGVFSVVINSRDVLNSLEFAASLLADPKNLVLIFPQGKMYSNFVNDLNLKNGVSKIIQKAKGSFKILFAVTFVENFKFKKPSVYIYLTDKENPNDGTRVDESFQEFYQSAKSKQAEIFY